MKHYTFPFLLAMLLYFCGTRAFSQTIYIGNSYDFSVENADGVTIYYSYVDDGVNLCVKTPKSGYYSGVVNVPEEVTYMNRTRKVTCIGDGAFASCRNLVSVLLPQSIKRINRSAFAYSTITTLNIPSELQTIEYGTFYKCDISTIELHDNIETIGEYAFKNSKLSSLTIPKNVKKIGDQAFMGIDFVEVISRIEEPFVISGKQYGDGPFSNNTFNNATLYVPSGTIDKYMSTVGWKDFLYIEEGNGGNTPESQKCEKPTINYLNGKLIFNCSTNGAICQSTITDTDIASYSSNEIQLNAAYNISVYATKAGYENSETVTATLCWIDVEPKTEGIENGIAQVRANPVLIQANNGQIAVNGVDDGVSIAAYSVSGKMIASELSKGTEARLFTNLRQGEIAIIKIGEKSVKMVMQ